MLSSRQAAGRGPRSALLVGLAATLGSSCEDCCNDGANPTACHDGPCKVCTTGSMVNDGCHSPCELGSPQPLDQSSDPLDLQCNNWPFILPCALEICSQPDLGYCCCVDWDEACVTAAEGDAYSAGPCAVACFLPLGG